MNDRKSTYAYVIGFAFDKHGKPVIRIAVPRDTNKINEPFKVKMTR